MLAVNEAIADAVAVSIAHYVMPAAPAGDALHLAMASFHKCDFLLTWNCQHLANANKFGHIRRINTLLGFFVPTIVTPLELLGESDSMWESDLDVCVVLNQPAPATDDRIGQIAWEVGFAHEIVIAPLCFASAEFEHGPMSESTLVANILHDGVAA